MPEVGKRATEGVVATSGLHFPDPLVHHDNRGTLISAAIWLVFLVQPLSAAWDSPDMPARIVGVAAVVAFGAAYVAIFQQLCNVRRGRSPHTARRSLLSLGGLCALAALSAPAAGQLSMNCMVYVAAASMMLANNVHRAVAFVTVLVSTVTIPLLVPGWTVDPGIVFGTVLATVAVFAMTKVFERNAQLTVAYEEIARLAVTEERDRISRDLHDILGHSLTVITVKAELAGRLLPENAAGAAHEVDDIERLAREALADVRSTIQGRRQVTLAVEIANARSALSGAGIEADLPTALEDVAGERRELFGWVVREGITNVVRHSGAARCMIRLDANCLEVVDDGRGPGEDCEQGEGTGLRGLRERVQQAGGVLVVAAAAGHRGFALRVEMPTATPLPA